ncbi:ABL1 [Mytilus coruscus]|uniref:ABL1 n=1 Tax=Mytilus coruscus TaxID=42192 RepID=A0A6J8DQI1_MYTCO|nr:ABL1 [Mytilus coruscus]
MAQNFALPCPDGTIVKCSNEESCLHAVSVRKQLETTGLITTYYEINPRQPGYSVALLSIVKDSKFVLVFYCDHVKSSLERILKQDLKSFLSKVIIVARSTDRLRNLKDFIRFSVFDSDKIIQHIQQIVDMTDQDRYPSIDQLHADPPSIPQRMRKSYTEQTKVKKLDTSPTLDKFQFTTNTVPSGFIHADTFDTSDTGNRGTHVLRSSCIPKVLFVSSVNDIKQRFNGATEEGREDLSKQIMSSTIKELIRNGDFLGMINLLDIDDRRIQTSVFSAIDSYQLQTNLCSRCIRGTEMLKGAKHLFELCRKWSANQFAMVSLLPLTLDTTAVLYLSSCVNGLSQSNLVPDIQIFTENSLPVVNKIILDNTLSASSSQCQYLLLSLRKLLDNMKCIGMNPSPLQMGNFRDALMNESNRDELKKKFVKSMTYLEQYSLLMVVINQIMLKSELQIVAFLSDLAVILLDKISKKSKSMQTIFPQLLLITKGVVQRLCKGSHLPRTTAEYQMKLCRIFNLFIDTTKISQIDRLHILNLTEPLLFKESKDIVQNIVYLFSKNNHRSKDIREKVSKHIVHHLSAINFKIDGVIHQSANVGLEPSWVKFAGTVSEEKNVVMHALIPTLHCISEGSMTDYKHKANKSETRKHLNTLDILRHLQDEKVHHNLIQLMAFQCRPLPIFYITDQSIDYDLNAHLLDARKVFKWISCRELTTMVADAVDAVGYLHNKAVIHRNVTTFAFSLRKNNVVLHDFSVSKVLGNNTGFISDLENTEIPVLWSAPESILEDHYDTKTDTWMIGQFIYEVFTHGCHPYTEVYGTPTEQLLEYIVFQDLKPQKWPCIPKDIHDIIIGCCMTKPEDRIDICRIGKLLNSILISLNGGRRNLVSHIFEEDKKYPEIDLQHEVPERGLPFLFEQLKQNNTQDRHVIRKSYFNIRKSQRRIFNELQITKADIKAPDQPIIQTKHSFISVYEPVTVDFVQSLPHLDKQTCTEILQMLDTPSREERRNIPGSNQYLLKYKLHKSTNLLELAFKHFCGDPEENEYEYLKIVQNIVKFIGEMHKRNWILRDLCADNIFVFDTNKEITMPRLGRMLWFDSNGVLDDCIIDEVKEDRRRWLPIEVLQNGQYSKEGDIYMFAMVVYELYMALDVHQHDNMASELECAPFAKVSISELLKTLYSGEVPMQPDFCPDWLYDIMKLCWNRDRTRRPTTNYILKEIMRNMETSTKEVANHSDQEMYDVPEDSETERDYEPLNETSSIDSENYDTLDSENYDSLDSENVDSLDDISLDKFNPSIETTSHCPIISIPKTGNTNPFDINKQHTSSFESRTSSLTNRFTKNNVQFSCVNSDTESERSTFKHHNVQSGHRSTFRSSFSSNGSRCANSMTSESENDYINDYQFTDAKSTKTEASASYISGNDVVFKDGVQTINEGRNQEFKEDRLNGSDSSKASSSYCHMDVNNQTSIKTSPKNTQKTEVCKSKPFTSKQSATPCDIRSLDVQRSKRISASSSDISSESSTYCHMNNSTVNTADEESESYKDFESFSNGNLCSRSGDEYLTVYAEI